MRSISFVAVLVVVSFLATASAVRFLPPYGTYLKITNLRDPHVMAVAQFAVSVYNLQKNKQLLFSKVVGGERQFNDGWNYRLDILVSSGTIYKAVLFEARNGSMRLFSFDPSPNGV